MLDGEVRIPERKSSGNREVRISFKNPTGFAPWEGQSCWFWRRKKNKTKKIFKLFLTNNNFNLEALVLWLSLCNPSGNSQHSYSFHDSPSHIISLYIKKRGKNPRRLVLFILLLMKEWSSQTIQLPSGPFFNAILMIINWQWLMAGTEVIEDTTAPFSPIQLFFHKPLFIPEQHQMNYFSGLNCAFKVHLKHFPNCSANFWPAFHILTFCSVTTVEKVIIFTVEIQENTHTQFRVFCR